MPDSHNRPPQSHLVTNLLHFARLLRGLGFRVGTRQIEDLAGALAHIDITHRETFYYTARSFLVHRVDDIDTFDMAFSLFWERYLTMQAEFGPGRRQSKQLPLDELEREGKTAIRHQARAADTDSPSEEEARSTQQIPTYSADERLARKDFADYDEGDLRQARLLIRALLWRLDTRRSRRRVRATKRASLIDMRRTLRRALAHDGEITQLGWRKRKEKPRPLVMICDISGSMEQYSRLFLTFMHELVQTGQPIETFVFGTRLTRITPALKHRHLQDALSQAASVVVDWSGGTRIGASLRTFNYRWSRRVLRRGAVVLVVSDGWDRGDIALLEHEMARLQRSSSHLIWLNPLLGHDRYQPLVRGIRAALPYIDAFLPIHNLESLEQIAKTLNRLTRI